MDITLFFSKILGPLLILVALDMLLKPNFFREVLEDFSKNAAVVFLDGIITFVIGLTVILLHNIWTMNLEVVITIFGWCSITKGVWLLFFPGSVCKFIQVYVREKKISLIHSFVILMFGAALTILGYFS